MVSTGINEDFKIYFSNSKKLVENTLFKYIGRNRVEMDFKNKA